MEDIIFDPTVAIVTMVGQNMGDESRIVEVTFEVLAREHVNIMAIAQGSSQRNISFAVAKKDMKTTLDSIHRDLPAGRTEFAQALPTVTPNSERVARLYESARPTADGT